MKSRFGRPSPAMIVALIALFVALGGASYAAVKLKKNAVKTKNIANKAVTEKKLAPSIRGKAVAYATVAANGTVNAGQSRGISDANIVKPGGAGGAAFCFRDLPAGANSAVATGIYDSSLEFEGPTLPSVAKAPLPDVDCNTVSGTQFEVITYRPAGSGTFTDGAFVIAFYQ